MLERTFKEDILVSFMNNNNRPGKWVPSKEILARKKCADYRTILSNELVIDIDAPQWSVVRAITYMINRTLIMNRIPFMLTYSGGRGEHYHIFFDDHHLFKVVDKREVKKFLFDYIILHSRLSIEAKYYDQNPISKSRSLIRVIGGKKISYKTMLTLYDGSKFVFNREIPDTRIYNMRVDYPYKVYIWNPIKILMNFRSSNIKERYVPELYEPIDDEYPYALTEWVYLNS